MLNRRHTSHRPSAARLTGGGSECYPVAYGGKYAGRLSGGNKILGPGGVQSSYIEEDTGDDGRMHHLRFNIGISNTNQNLNDAEGLIPATFFESLTQPLLYNCKDYLLAVERFKIPIQTIPLFYFQDIESVGVTETSGSATVSIPVAQFIPTVNATSLQQAQSLVRSVQIGYRVSGANIPLGTTIIAVNPALNPPTVTLSQVTTAFAPSPAGFNININLSSYSVTLDNNGLSPQQVFLVYQNESTTANGVLLQPVFSTQAVLDMFNVALQTAFTALQASANPLVGALYAPYFIFDATTGLVTLIAQQNIWQSDLAAGGRIFVNGAAHDQFFYSFQGITHGQPNAFGEDFEILVKNNGNNTYQASNTYTGTLTTGTNTITAMTSTQGVQVGDAVYIAGVVGATTAVSTFYVTVVGAHQLTLNQNYTLTGGPIVGAPVVVTPSTPAYAMSEEHASLGSWSQLESIVLTTAQIPVRSEVIQATQFLSSQLVNPNPSVQTAGQFASRQILTDFVPTLDPFGNVGDVLQFYPNGPLRYMDMLHSGPLNVIDLSIFWTDRYQNIYPLMLSPQSFASVKLFFKRRGGIDTSD
jgi:hypothetical protein